MIGARKYYAKENKLEKDKPYDFTNMYNLRNKTKKTQREKRERKTKKQTLNHRNKMMVNQRGGGSRDGLNRDGLNR